MIAGYHILRDRLLKVAAVFLQPQIDSHGAGVNEAVEIGALRAHALQQIERSHGVDVQILAIVEGATEGSGQVVDGVHALDRLVNVVPVA